METFGEVSLTNGFQDIEDDSSEIKTEVVKSTSFKRRKQVSFIGRIHHFIMVIFCALIFTLVFFLVLPLMQTIAKPIDTDLIVQNIEITKLPPPPPVMEEEEKKEPEPEEKPPELMEDSQPLDLAQLELALNPGFSEGWLGGDFAVQLNTVVSGNKDVDALFSIADLDQKPRVVYQPGPILNKELRQRTPGSVYVVFIVNQDGRVENPKVQKSTDPLLEKAALSAIKKWKFEPGKRNGQSVKFRMRVPIIFPEGQNT